MTDDNLPAVRTSSEVAKADTDSWIQVMGPLVKLADSVASTEFVPRQLRGKPAAVTAALLYGREVGLPPMTALTMTHVIEGRPAMSAEGMRALILAAGHDIETLESTGALCRMRGRRRGSETWTAVEWSIDSARAAGLLAKDNWKNYPRQMLQARCSAELARLVFPDVIHGFRATEELDDTAEVAPAPPAPPASMTTVKRASRAAKKATPAAALPAGQRPAAAGAGMPLPGEPGYEDLAPAEAPSAGDEQAGPPAEEPDQSDEGRPDEEQRPDEQRPAGQPETETTEAQVDVGGARPVSKGQLAMLNGNLRAFIGGTGDEQRLERLSIVSRIVGREVDTTSDLTVHEAGSVIDTVARVRNLSDLYALLDAIDEAKS